MYIFGLTILVHMLFRLEYQPFFWGEYTGLLLHVSSPIMSSESNAALWALYQPPDLFYWSLRVYMWSKETYSCSTTLMGFISFSRRWVVRFCWNFGFEWISLSHIADSFCWIWLLLLCIYIYRKAGLLKFKLISFRQNKFSTPCP
jgi:hypothetical protein